MHSVRGNDQRMRVAHFVTSYLPLTEGWIHNELACNTQCENHVICRTTENRLLYPLANVHAVHARRSPLSIVSMVVARARARYPLKPVLRLVQKIRPHILHGHFVHESWRNIQVARITGLPLVTTFYGLDVNKLPRRSAWQRRYPVLFREGSLFIVEGPHMASRLAGLGCPPEKIRTIYQAADGERIAPHVGRRVNDETVRVLFVGLARFKKGAIHAVRAFMEVAEQMPGLELHLVGNGPYAKQARNYLKSAGLLDRAVFHGYTGYETYLSLLGQCDILLAPSVTAPNGDTEGGAPVCIVEALLAGVPVVATNHCDIPNIVAHEETGLLCGEGDTQSLAHNLLRMASDSRLRERMGARARKTSPKEHDIRVRVREITTAYEALLA